ncbi:nucleotide-binding domain-containing protein [Tothia fuscella]|uniref:Nucleotide-binding domain-containing protein n=1 Tax=Tothia fuscella TaxID=1048955 RepID=A0A9P4U328_9PEZI|nr:nucleotide-binding domain-containing protein [Tothia fuscella]
MPNSPKHIVVIGAGVIGFQTTISLLEAGYKVTILAKHFPGDKSIEYTSPWAGAQWRSHAAANDIEQQKWDIETYNYWLSIIARELNKPETTVKSGLGIYESIFYSTETENPWFAKNVLSFKAIGSKEISGKIQHGHIYSSIMANVPMYLDYLYDTAISLGATPIRATLPRSSTLAGTLKYATEELAKEDNLPKVDAFVNATGISAMFLVPDEDVYPIRGQTITVKGEAKRITTIDASPSNPTPESPNIMYILPRPHSGTTVLGGTKQAHNWSAEPDEKTTREILEMAKSWAPELLDESGEFEVVSVQVGLRPGRIGGARVELEEVRQPGGIGEPMVVCHAYGHAGAGYQNSVGSAKKVVGLLSKRFQEGLGSGSSKL